MVNGERKKNKGRRRTKDTNGSMETVHLLRSPRNAERLVKALRRATSGEGKPESLDKLKGEPGLGAGS